MHVFVGDARYQKHIMASLAVALDECKRDKRLREYDGGPGAYQVVEPERIDDSATGSLVILIGPVNDSTDFGDHLKAFTSGVRT